MQDDFQKKVLETLKKNLKAVDLSDEQPEVQSVEPVEEPQLTAMSSDVTAFAFPTAAGPTSGGNKDILILPGYGGAAATSASQINFYWNSPTTPDTTGVGTSIRTTIFNYATTATNPVLVVGGYNGTSNLMPAANYGGGSGTTARIWIDPFLARIDLDYVGFNAGVADTNVAGVLFYDSSLNVFKGGTGSGSGKTIAFTTDIPAQAASASLIVTDASTATRYLVGTVLNTASSGGTTLSTGSGITIGNNVITATTFQGTATTATNVYVTAQTTGTFYPVFTNTSSTTNGVALSVESGISWDASTNTLTATTFSGTASSSTNTANANITLDTTSTIYLTGSRSNASIGSTPVYVLSGVSALGNTITATTFSGSLSGTAAIATSSVLLNTTTDTSSTLYLLGSRTSTGFAGTAVYVDSNISFAGNTITGNLTGTASIATSSITSATTTDTTSTLYLLGTRSNGGFAGTALYVDTGISALGNTITAVTFSGTATTATNSANTNITLDTTSTIYLTGSRSNASIGSTPVYVLSGVSALGNTITATTFSGSLSGTASIASSSILSATTTDTTSTLYLLGSRSSTGFAGTSIFVDSGISALGNTITATTFSGNLSGTATSAALVNTDASTATRYLVGTVLNTASGSTQLSTGSGITIGNNILTATTFQGSLSGTASTSTTSVNLNTYTLSGVMYLTGQASSTGGVGASQFVGSGISFASASGLLTATSYAGSGALLSGIVTSLAASTGISVNASTGAVTVTNTGVIALTGTANQVLVNGGSGSATSGNITLTLPQSIGTGSTPSFADIVVTNGTSSTLATVGTSGTSIVNKQYVDNLASGLDVHASVRLLQGSQFTANYVQSQGVGNTASGSYLISTTQVALPAIDGVTVSATGASQRVLVTNGFSGTASIAGTTPFTPGNSFIGNGIYYVAALGGAGTSNWILIRATDTDDNTELTAGTFCFIEEGTSYADSGWACSNDTTNLGPIQFGSTAITFTQFTGGGALGVGQGLTKVGNTVATKVNLFSTGSASGTGFTQFNIGGAGSAGVADTGYYPTFSVRTSGTVAGSATLTLNSDGFSLVGSTSSNRTITVTGSDITLTGGGNTLTLTGSISLPAPTQNGVAYGSSGTAVAFLTAGGSGASVLTQTTGSAPVYLGQSQLVVGGASTAANIYAGTTNQLVYQTGANTTGFVTNAAGSGASVLTQTSGSAPAYLPQSQLLVGSATSAALVNTDASTATRYLVGTVLNTASGSTQLSTGSGITIGNNVITATTFQGSLSGTAAIATSSITSATTTDTTSTLYLLGTRSNGGFAGTAIYVDTGISALGNTITATTFSGTATSATNTANANITLDTTSTIYLTGSRSNASIGSTPVYVLSGVSALGNTITATTFSGNLTGTASIASSSILVATTADTTSTLYLLGTRSNAGFAGTAVYVDTGISALGNTITATTFSGNLSGTATSAALVNTDASTATRYLIGTVLNTASGSTQMSTGSGITIGNNLLTSSGIAVTGTTGATSTSSGALIVTGGVGIGGSLWTSTTNFSSISGVGHSNSVITSGVWSGTAVSLANGGTNANLTAVNGGVVYSTASAMAISAAGTAGSVLVSAGAAAPTWSTVALGSANSVSGTLGISNGGNNNATYVTNGITYYTGTAITAGSSLTYLSGSGVTATENIRAAGFNIAGNSVITSVTPSGGSAIYGALTLAVANNGSSNTLSIAGSGQTITITGPGTGITGTGTANNVAKFTATGTLGNSNITDNGTTIALGKATTITDSALSNGTYLTITTAAGDDNSTTDFFIRGLNSSSTSKFSVDANGNLRATTKSFDIEHPTKPGMRLVYGVLEGPEHGVYHRGTIEGKGKLTVELPEYWSKLVGAEYSIQLTTWGNYNVHIVEKSETSFIIQLTGDPISRMLKNIKVDYIVHGSRLDAPLQIEQ